MPVRRVFNGSFLHFAVLFFVGRGNIVCFLSAEEERCGGKESRKKRDRGECSMLFSQEFMSQSLKFLFLLTPFFVLSMFLAMTNGWTQREKIRLAGKIIFAALVVSLTLFFFGNWIFHSFGITLDAFRIGGGALLFLSAVGLVNGAAAEVRMGNPEESDIAVVPLAIPVTVGPGTTGALLVMGAEAGGLENRLNSCLALLFALLCLGAILCSGPLLERILGRRGIVILSKLTGLVLAALAAQMIFTGIQGFFPIPVS